MRLLCGNDSGMNECVRDAEATVQAPKVAVVGTRQESDGDVPDYTGDVTDLAARARNPLAFLDAEIDELKATGLYRRLRVVESEQKSRCVIDGREVITL